MSVSRGLPPDVRRGIERIRQATLGLVDAVESENQSTIDDALARRGEEIESLQPHVAAYRRDAGADAESALADAWSQIEADTAQAFRALEQLRTRLGNEIEQIARESVAIRGYGEAIPGGSALDRRG